jgi:hypothetical protein
MKPDGRDLVFEVLRMENDENAEVPSAPHPGQEIRLTLQRAAEGSCRPIDAEIGENISSKAGPEELPENVFARRVADTEGSVDLGDYQLQTLKAALDRTEEGTRVTLLLEANADHLWYGSPRMHGTLTAACGGETTSREILWQSNFRRLRRHYIYAVAQFEGDLLAEQALTLHFTNGERSFTLPITLKGGDVHEP